MNRNRDVDLHTLAVHGPIEATPRGGPVEPPLVLSSAFRFESAAVAESAFASTNAGADPDGDPTYIYGRWQNPSVLELERTLAALEGGEAAIATASGMAAVSGVALGLLRAGDHVVAPRALYGETARLFRERLPRFGIDTTFVERPTADAFTAAARASTKLFYVETPTNPTLALTDIRAVADRAKSHGALVAVDSTFATPICQRPLDLGADLVIHSMTKALSGHGDAIGGAVITSRALRDRVADTIVKGLGGVLAPFNAFLVARGIRTLALRVERSCASALAIARHLEAHPRVRAVHYPGLERHPDHALAKHQMQSFGAILSFELEDHAACRAALDRFRLATHAVSLGDVRTLVTHPASTTASTMPREDRIRAGIGDGLMRLSVGIESLDDLLRDLDQALAA
jgi:methionine-gamma-lyase